MPVTMTKKTVGPATVTTKQLLSSFKKDLGDSVGQFGGLPQSYDRLPTGLFPLDLALGGGFPRGKTTTIFGPESSNKTNIALRAIAMHQLLWPKKTCVFIAIEGFDPDWAAKMGVDVEKLIVLQPSYAEQVADMAESFLFAEDCGVVVIDSLAAMITTQEAQKSAESAQVGGAGLVVGKLVRKTTLALNESEKAGRSPTLIYINQIRYKIGVMFGNPETTPGGNGPLFQSAIRLRVYGKNVIDNKVSSVMPVAKEVSFTLPKNKVPILAASGKFEMVTIPHDGLSIGECDDWNQLKSYMMGAGMLDKDEKKGWTMLGAHYDTLTDCRKKITEDRPLGAKVRADVIAKRLADGDYLEGAE